jgi:hypothetical protein
MKRFKINDKVLINYLHPIYNVKGIIRQETNFDDLNNEFIYEVEINEGSCKGEIISCWDKYLFIIKRIVKVYGISKFIDKLNKGELNG